MSATTAARPGSAVAAVIAQAPRMVLVGLVRFYQLVISPWTPPTCKYYPSCSSYAVTALERHGALRGSWLAARRLGRCHPWSDGGVDDVPPAGYWHHDGFRPHAHDAHPTPLGDVTPPASTPHGGDGHRPASRTGQH